MVPRLTRSAAEGGEADSQVAERQIAVTLYSWSWTWGDVHTKMLFVGGNTHREQPPWIGQLCLFLFCVTWSSALVP